MYPKAQIEDLVKTENGELAQFVGQQSNGKGILSILENLGYLPANFDAQFLLDLVDSDNPKIRLLAIKNLAS